MRLIAILLLTMIVPLVSGCFPVVAGGAGATALILEDRRTAGTYIEDEGIELKTGNRISERFRDQVHVNVTSYNRVVLLTGEHPPTSSGPSGTDRPLKENVRNVVNEISIAGPVRTPPAATTP